MHLSANGLRRIAGYEGWVPHTYRDAVGILTIGFGHVVRRGERFPAAITRIRGLQILRRDAAAAERAVRQLVKVPINQNRFDALVSFVFNVGAGAFASSTLLRKLNHHDYRGAANEFPRWARAGGRALPGLLARRHSEQALFNRHP